MTTTANWNLTTTANAPDWSPVTFGQKSSSFNSKFETRAQVLSTHHICQPFRFAVVVKFNLQWVVKLDLQSVVKFNGLGGCEMHMFIYVSTGVIRKTMVVLQCGDC